tara:strand:+ start:1119 stop:1940 length:822 start_codon:yes stop_codon:yes gene_type:complete
MTLPTLDLTESKALVVGGAGGGIGSAISLSLMEAGAELFVITIDSEHADAVIKEGEALGGEVHAEVADVTDDQAFSTVLEKILSTNAPVNHLVNVVGGAGVTDWSRAKDYRLETFDRILSRNLRYALVSCQRFTSALVETEQSGSIVNISSIATRAVPLLTGYGAAKAGLEAMTRTMAAEWGQYGIRVNAVAPGTVKTPRVGQSDLEEAAQKIPLRRRANPKDIADATLFLLSPKADYITGQTLTVDGGATLGASGDNLPVFVTNPEVRKQFD